LNGALIFDSKAEDFAVFSKEAYKNFELNYPKFFKMDQLSKLAFLASELALQHIDDVSSKNNIALVFANRSSSLDTDIKFQNSISDKENYFPSPAVFVYTLPNICLGEISIRHQLNSENSFFIFDAFNSEFMVNYSNMLLNTNKADQVLCGWIDYLEEEYTAFLYLISRQEATIHDKQTIETLYNS
jgi:hypothetical protein